MKDTLAVGPDAEQREGGRLALVQPRLPEVENSFVHTVKPVEGPLNP